MKKLAFILAGLFITAEANSRHMVSDAHLYYGQDRFMLIAMNPGNQRPTGDHFRDFECEPGRPCESSRFAAAPPPPPQRTEPARPEPQNRTATARSQITREHITNPFFQPKTGQVTSLTDVGYMGESISMNVDLGLGTPGVIGPFTGEWNFSNDSFAVSQNVAVGVTDDIAIIGNVRYLISDAAVPAAMAGSGTDSRVDTFGLGARWLFVDNQDWVGYVQGSVQSVTDLANLFSARVQVGYKNDDTVIFVFGQAQYYDWRVGDIGPTATNGLGQMLYFEVMNNLTGSMHFEAGAGAFMAFNNEWALDATVALADRDWHRQVYGQVRLNYQPWDNAAVSIYGRMALWDNMDNLNDLDIWYSFPAWGPGVIGTADIIGSNSIAVGAQLTLLF